ncbi:MAG: ribosome-associated protein, partial [Comamonadaceae bacterium]
EQKRNKAPRAHRELFRELRELLAADGDADEEARENQDDHG